MAHKIIYEIVTKRTFYQNMEINTNKWCCVHKNIPKGFMNATQFYYKSKLKY